MKILGLSLRNLNSLFGTWSVDFTAPEFAATGIFAITGPTGAGKSTLLDGICLALFGRTPRLGAVTKGSNEIMSRRAGDCFAEVSFATDAGSFRCHWSQHRARHKADGELQTPRHEIVNAASGKVLESRSREVVRQVERITGMDYDRFTRSILLAQGEFAAFLNADADQRAPILEQITGTEIYTRLSVATHERTMAERKHYESMRDALQGVQLLSPEDRRTLVEDITRKSTVAGGLQEKLGQTVQALQRLDRVDQLQRKTVETEAALAELARARELAADDRKRLVLGQWAQTLAPAYQSLQQVIVQIHELEAKSQARQARLEKFLAEQEGLHKEFAQAEQLLERSRATWEHEQVRMKEVRSLDVALHAQRKRRDELRTSLRQLQEQREQGVKQQEQLAQQRAAVRVQEEKLRLFFSGHAADEQLVEQLAVLRQQLLQVDGLEKQQVQEKQLLAEARAQLAELEKHSRQLELDLAQARQQATALKEQREQLRQQQAEQLQGEEPSVLRGQLGQLEEELRQQERGIDLLSRQETLTREVAEQLVRLKELTTQLQAMRGELAQLEEQRGLAEKLVAQCEANQQMLLRIHSYEEERRQLKEGQPCPLCGATAHPWAVTAPGTEGHQSELEEAKMTLRQCQEKSTTQRETLAVLERDLQHGEAWRAEGEQQRGVLQRELESLSFVAPLLTAESRASRDTLVQTMDSRHQSVEALRVRLQAVDGLESQLQAVVRQQEVGTVRFEESQQRVLELGQQLTLRQEALRHREARLQENDQGLYRLRETVLASLRPLSISEVPDQGALAVLALLEARQQLWKKQCEQRKSLEKEVQTLTAEQDRLKDRLHGLAAQLEEQEGLSRQQQAEEEELARKRRELYGELDPDVEEQRLRKEVAQAEDHEKNARERVTATDQEVRSLGDQQQLDAEAQATLRPRREQMESELLGQVRAGGLSDLQAFAAALLPPVELQKLAAQQQRLETQQVQLDARKKEYAQALAAEKEQLTPEQNREMLLAAQTSLQGQLENVQQEIGAARQRLADDDRQNAHCQEQQQALARQQAELQRWELLHSLIGSADGKKFRVFAQGLTFEVMVSHANRQLRKMSDRYILLRDSAEPLELLVMDNYQAGEVRSTRNLSGGESFLVSLALSLGLSAMAGHSIRVDSLFLDEGFGTLDEESLDTALQTLAELQQDGKLIGIISHVPQLQDRIGVRIQVIPGSDGCSRLQGPGCSQL